MHLVEAWDLTPSKGEPDADERIETGLFTVDEVMKMIRSVKSAMGKPWWECCWLFGADRSHRDFMRLRTSF